MSTEQTIEMTAEEWIAAHPEVQEAAPEWADSIRAEDDGTNISLSFEKRTGAVEIGVAAVWDDGAIRVPDAANYKSPVFLYFHKNETSVTAADLRQYAADFAAAADAIECKKRTLRRAPEVSEQLMDLDASR